LNFLDIRVFAKKYSVINVNENISSGSRAVPWGGRTATHDVANVCFFCNYAKSTYKRSQSHVIINISVRFLRSTAVSSATSVPAIPLYNLLTYLLTPRNRVLLEKLTGSQLVKKFPAFYGSRNFITAFMSALYLSLY